jgi:chromatin remodeling complex protein RSC6
MPPAPGTGILKVLKVSPALSKIIGAENISRPQSLKKVRVV